MSTFGQRRVGAVSRLGLAVSLLLCTQVTEARANDTAAVARCLEGQTLGHFLKAYHTGTLAPDTAYFCLLADQVRQGSDSTSCDPYAAWAALESMFEQAGLDGFATGSPTETHGSCMCADDSEPCDSWHTPVIDETCETYYVFCDCDADGYYTDYQVTSDYLDCDPGNLALDTDPSSNLNCGSYTTGQSCQVDTADTGLSIDCDDTDSTLTTSCGMEL